MKEIIRIPMGRSLSWLAICALLSGVNGCAQFAQQPLGGQHPTIASPQPITPPAVMPAAGQPMAPSYTTAPSNVVPAGYVSSGTESQAGQQTGDRNRGTPGAVVQTGGTRPYTARQFPGTAGGFGAPAGPPLTAGNDFGAPFGPGIGGDPYAPYANYQPRVREADLIISGFPARTGRIMLGGAVNSDAGVTGQLTVDERNFDIMRWPRSFQDLFSGTAFRGAGQTFRIEAAPGSQFQRYTAQFADPNLFGYQPISMSLSGFLYDRRFDDWDEARLGGRLIFGYRVTQDLSLSFGLNGQSVDITRPSVPAGFVPQLDAVLGTNSLYGGEVALRHDNRDSAIQASEGHFLELKYEQVFGDFDYGRFDGEFRQYWLLAQRADGSGKQTLSYSTQLGFSGDDTPIFQNFFAGGYATIRGFDFRGASPVVNGVEVGGQFQWLNTLEYMFPITADDAFRGVAFVDFGTVEQNVKIEPDNYRVAPGLGVRVAIPMLGPAPLAFDFAYPVAQAATDQRRIFSFYMSLIR